MHVRLAPDTYRTLDQAAFLRGTSRGTVIDEWAANAIKPPCPLNPS